MMSMFLFSELKIILIQKVLKVTKKSWNSIANTKMFHCCSGYQHSANQTQRSMLILLILPQTLKPGPWKWFPPL